MRRSTIFLSTAAVLVLSAGMVVGRLSAHLPTPAKPAEHSRGWFPDELGLSADQDQKMKAIWADVNTQIDKNHERQHALDRERDASIHSLLSSEQSAAYDKIFQEYHANRAVLDKDREQCFRSGKERTRALLTPDQQIKMDAMEKDMHEHDHHGPGGPQGRGHGGPSTRPDANNAATGPVL